MPESQSSGSKSKPAAKGEAKKPAPKPVRVVVLKGGGEIRRGAIVTLDAEAAESAIKAGSARRANSADLGVAGLR